MLKYYFVTYLEVRLATFSTTILQFTISDTKPSGPTYFPSDTIHHIYNSAKKKETVNSLLNGTEKNGKGR